jgi:hypothetical protein
MSQKPEFTNCTFRSLRHLHSFRETNGDQWDLHWFHGFSLDVPSLIVTTSAFVKKKKVKDETSKKFVKPMEVKLRSKISH